MVRRGRCDPAWGGRSLQCRVPSPVGHVLGGVAAGWLVAGRHRDPGVRPPGWLPHVAARWWREGAVFGALGAAPDLDLLVGAHSTYTHSVGAAAIVAGLAYVLRGRRPARWAIACGLAMASHVLLDWLGSDTTPPIGIMALWPFSPEFYQSPLSVFPAVSRQFGQWSFVSANTGAAACEIVILGPLVIAVGWWRGRRPRASADASDP